MIVFQMNSFALSVAMNVVLNFIDNILRVIQVPTISSNAHMAGSGIHLTGSEARTRKKM